MRPLFLRLLGAIFFVAFVSLATQVRLLAGEDGLEPAPPILGFRPGGGALLGACVAGAAGSAALALLAAPRLALAAIWALYLWLTTACGQFLGFQWDNLLIETAFFAFFYAPWGWLPFRGEAPPPPHPAFRFLLVWLLFRLNFESGVAKLRFGDPTWSLARPTAMVSYYETAPLPTWIGWWVHQLPEWGHVLCGWFTLAVELVVPFLLFGGNRARRVAVAIFVPFQLSILLTANYFIFNYLSLALCLPALERTEGRLRDRWLSRLVDWRGRLAAALAGLLFVATLLPAAVYLLGVRRPSIAVEIASELAPLRTFNIYHLFANMTLTRPEVEIQGSDDGVEWKAYDFHHKPGDLARAPGFVAPHQPRVDFLLWFLVRLRADDPDRPRIGWSSHSHEYLNRLVDMLSRRPEAAAPLFRVDPFGGRSPRYVRLAFWRYRMTSLAERRETGAWWKRELVTFHPYVHDARSGRFPAY